MPRLGKAAASRRTPKEAPIGMGFLNQNTRERARDFGRKLRNGPRLLF
jgi:hypothetical protein